MYGWNTSCSEINRAGLSVKEMKCRLLCIGRVMIRAVHMSTLNKTTHIYICIYITFSVAESLHFAQFMYCTVYSAFGSVHLDPKTQYFSDFKSSTVLNQQYVQCSPLQHLSE
jgi:hypothetical protein